MGGKSKSTSTTTTDMGPWSGQQPYVKDAFSEAERLYNERKGSPGYQGGFFAGLTPQQTSIIDEAINYYNTQGRENTNLVNRTATGQLIDGTVGVADTAGGLAALGQDQTANNIARAGQYADNPYISGIVDATMRDATRTASEGVLPNLYRDAASSGNLNSSRTALAQGVVERGLAEKAADVSASLRGDAYSQGIGAALTGNQQQASALGAAGGLFDSMAGRGYGGMIDATNLASSAYGDASAYAGQYQGENQRELDEAKMRFEYNDTRPDDLLARYYGIIGANNWGQTGTSTTTTTQKSSPGVGSIIGGALGAVGSLFNPMAGIAGGAAGLGRTIGGSATGGGGISPFGNMINWFRGSGV